MLLLSLAALPVMSCAAHRAAEVGVVLHTDQVIAAPPPPQIVYETNPHLEAVPGSPVLVVDDPGYDMFMLQGAWYLTSHGYWYRAGAHDGPYIAIAARSVPREILQLPPGSWRHRPPRGGPS
jgi:hypothetical protein